MKASDKRPADGAHKELFADGGLSGKGLFKNGKRYGKWQFYYRNGKPKAIGKYVAADLDGHWEWWRCAQLRSHKPSIQPPDSPRSTPFPRTELSTTNLINLIGLHAAICRIC